MLLFNIYSEKRTDMEPRNAISIRVNELLRERKWTVYRLSVQSGLPSSTLFNIMRGKCKSCNFDTIINICRGFGIEVTEFLDSKIFSLENLSDDN